MDDKLPKSVQDLAIKLADSTLTKSEFETLLKKAAQPKQEVVPEGTEILEFHPSGDYSDKYKHQDKTEGKED